MHRRQVSDSRVTLLPSMPWEGGCLAPHASRSLGALLVPPVAAMQSTRAGLVSFLDFGVLGTACSCTLRRSPGLASPWRPPRLHSYLPLA